MINVCIINKQHTYWFLDFYNSCHIHNRIQSKAQTEDKHNTFPFILTTWCVTEPNVVLNIFAHSTTYFRTVRENTNYIYDIATQVGKYILSASAGIQFNYIIQNLFICKLLIMYN